MLPDYCEVQCLFQAVILVKYRPQSLGLINNILLQKHERGFHRFGVAANSEVTQDVTGEHESNMQSP